MFCIQNKAAMQQSANTHALSIPLSPTSLAHATERLEALHILAKLWQLAAQYLLLTPSTELVGACPCRPKSSCAD